MVLPATVATFSGLLVQVGGQPFLLPIEAVERGDVRIVISGDQKIKELTVRGIGSDEVVNALNDAVKQSQQLAAKKLQEMSGGLGGLLGGMGGGQ